MSSEFVDHDKIDALLEKAQEALAPVGLSFDRESVQVMLQAGQLFAMIPCLIRPGAGQKLDEDREARDEFLQQMRDQHQAKIDKKKENLAKMLEYDFDEDAIPEDCSHEHRHPTEGFCITCGDGLED